jgi:predicted HAD superfamily Cof-like phosphohydrolase
MEKDNLDLEASDRFLLHALESASTEVQQRALRTLGHESLKHRNNELKAETQRANRNARRAEEQERRAQDAENEVEKWRDSAHEAERSAEALSKRVHELEDLLHNTRGTMLMLAADVFDKVGDQ